MKPSIMGLVVTYSDVIGASVDVIYTKIMSAR